MRAFLGDRALFFSRPVPWKTGDLMPRMSPLALLAFLTACDTGLNTVDDSPPVRAENLFPSGSEAEVAVAEDMAYDHLAALDRLDGVGDLWTETVAIDELSTAHIKITQTVQGVPVDGGETIVHLKPNGTINAVTDNLLRSITVTDVTPSYTAEEALEAAADLTQGFEKLTNLPEPELVIVRIEGEDLLAWKIQLEFLNGDDRTAMPMVYMDAESNELLYQYDNLQSVDATATTSYNGSVTFPVTFSGGRYELRGEGIGTYSFDNAEPHWSSFNGSHLSDVTSGSTTYTGEDVAVDAHYGAHMTMEFLDEVHGRNGVNGSGGPRLKDSVITSGVHYGNNYNNAFWNGRAMVYGDGDGSTFSPLTSLDVAAHEMGHGVTEYTAGLVYRNESGALNEAFSDILGARVEAWVEGMSDDVWEIGEDCYTPWNSTDAMRYMDNPTQDGSSRDHYSTRYTGSADNGGVHWNSGIANLAFYLTTEGGDHPKSSKRVVTVQGIGMAKAGAIYYRALSLYMTANTTFAGARQATLNAAADLYGQGSVEYATVGNAWAEVGVGGVLPYPGGPIDEPTPDPTTPAGDGNATNVSAAHQDWARYTVEIPSGATEALVQISGGTGDADLYVRSGDAPTEQAYDCRPYRSGNIEECRIENPPAGTLHIGIRAWQAFSGVDLSTTVTGGTVPDEPTFSFLEELDLADSQGNEQTFVLEVPAGATNLVFTTTGGTGDADLYIKEGSAPTTSDYDCRPYRAGNEETCTVAAPVAGEYHVMLRAYNAYNGVTLTGTWE
jgi:vibriolysin